ncbi:Adenine-specific DNA methylase containing a Zn-ribbon-like protein [Mesorhizobium prunaredense]|uniref:Adenine-specific DNA methylase containing a Zn-ribbon-like protein n=1 Tax=Mesorhizobium prunaredense TaxID=1631249 RepID=A0A1R3VII8_9HYPH|nr:hypothetical protein [Mesorhizobium prunaredense]SIT58683.1 Adenine-specific DNA methylase containing a Zn-ribbon-like protein [Mesorhizobium prunaredense]
MSVGLPEQSLLDAGILPVGEIAQIAKREGVRPRPAYQSHRWFARRLAVTARSLAVAATTPSDRNFWSAYYGDASCEGVCVLDPFMGGGVMLLEASRLGADIFGTDIEPVAAAVSDFQGRLSQLNDLGPILEALKATVGAELAQYYKATDAEGNEETLLHAFWVQQHMCSNCEHTFDAHPTLRLAWNDDAKREWIICQDCGEIAERTKAKRGHLCACGIKTMPSTVRLDHGAAVCPCCGTKDRLIDVAKSTGTGPQFRLFAVETIPSGIEKKYPNVQRRIRKATFMDLAVFAKAAARLAYELELDSEFLACGPIPKEGRSDNRLIQYGYADYGDLFGARQKLHLGLLAREVSKLDGAVGEAMKIAFSNHLTTNNMLCAYAGGWRRLTGLFSIRAYRHIARPVELNPWLERNGRGTFPNAVRAVQRAAKAMREATEPTIADGTRTVRWFKPGSWDVRCRDARNLEHIEAESVDLVLTDPPYFNYIAYSELGHFFVPWMVRFRIVDTEHLSAFPSGQLAKAGSGLSAAKAFGESLGEAMKEVRRVCKPDARIVFTYQNLDGRGWQSLASALAVAGIRPIRVWPMYGDSSGGLHKRANSISWDCVVLCRQERCASVDPVVDHASAGAVEAEAWSKRLLQAGHKLAPGDIRNLTHAASMVEAFNRAFTEAAAHEAEGVRSEV